MIAVLLLNLPRGGAGAAVNYYVERQARRNANARKLRDEELRRKVLAEIHEEQEQVEQLQRAAIRLEADAEFSDRLERAASELAELELEALRARTARLHKILRLVKAVEEELDDEHALLLLM